MTTVGPGLAADHSGVDTLLGSSLQGDVVAISEHDRYEMYRWFQEHAGARVAGTLMAVVALFR